MSIDTGFPTASPQVPEQAPQRVQQDYFGFGGEEQFFFPDGVTFITFKVMNEGQRAKYQKLTSRDFIMDQKRQEARVPMNPAEERHALLKSSIVGWNLVRRGNPVPFNERSLLDFLIDADPRLVDKIETAIRKANPWLLNELSVKDIDDQIEQLQEQRVVALEREAGEGSSSNK